MKIALCMHGYFANAGGAQSSIVAHQYLRRKVLNEHDVDVFVHSWDLPNEEQIRRLYQPTDAIFEPQYSFEEELNNFNEEWFNEGFDRGSTMYHTNTIFRGLSYLYSRKRAIEIKKQYEETHGFEYDCVILARFDISTRGKEHQQIYYVTNMNFESTLDMKYL